jgi:hypothetical protein
MSYESDIASGSFVPSQKALVIASTSPETHPDKYTFLGTMGWVYTGPERFDTSRTEHTGWVNRNLGFSGFGGRAGSFKDIYDDPDPQPEEQPPFEDVEDEVLDDPAPADDSKSIDEICAGPVPEPGTFARQSYDRYCVSPTDPIVETPVAPTLPSTATLAGSSGGVFTGMAPKGLSYSRQEAPSMISSAPKVDYIKLLRGFLTESLFRDYI